MARRAPVDSYSSLSLAFGSRIDSQGGSFFAETALKDGALVITPGQDADGFLAKLLPEKLSADASVTIGIDSRLGVYFSGSAGLEIQIPAHISLGPIEIMSVTIAVKPTSGALPIELGATLQGNLGPLQAVVENVGVRIPLTFPAHGGNLGPVNAGLQFKPPTGVGLSLNAGVVTGGGFLSFDPDRGEYAGALQLGIADFLTVSAIGLISTRMPDGSRGFSLLIIITADFGTGIQLSFGFTLLAVGGLLGLNRTVPLPAADGRREVGRDSERDVPAERHRQRAADHQRPARALPAPGRDFPDRTDGEDRLGHADPHQPVARRDHRDSAGQRRDPRRH